MNRRPSLVGWKRWKSLQEDNGRERESSGKFTGVCHKRIPYIRKGLVLKIFMAV